MASQVGVYNLALARIGVFDSAIQDIDEQSKAAQVCGLFFDTMRDYVLEDFPWPFAERRVALAEVGTAPTNWEYMYQYPADCLVARYITLEGSRNPRVDLRIPFQIANNTDSKVILCDVEDAELVYTAQVTDLNLWPNMAVSALAYRLAAEIALPLAVKPDLAANAMNAYFREVSKAMTLVRNEQGDDKPPVSEFIAIRGGSVGPIDSNENGLRF